MKTEQAIAYAGGRQALADLLDITQSAISQWEGEVPPARQLQLEKLSDGTFKADPDCLERMLDPQKKKAAA
jgi:DNA-binding transcriptional regulator YdaS (Cro superfamily)